MSINEIPRKRVAAPAPTESIFANALGAPKRRRSAENEYAAGNSVMRQIKKRNKKKSVVDALFDGESFDVMEEARRKGIKLRPADPGHDEDDDGYF